LSSTRSHSWHRSCAIVSISVFQTVERFQGSYASVDRFCGVAVLQSHQYSLETPLEHLTYIS
jgi:hypothetical protein